MKKRIALVAGILVWLTGSAVCYSINGYLGIAAVVLGGVIFYMLRHRERKAAEKAAPEGGLYAGLHAGVIYKTKKDEAFCQAALQQKLESDPVEFDFSWDEGAKTGLLALYCKKGGLRPGNFPSSFVVSFSQREDGLWILVRYLDPTAESSVMTRVDIDGFLREKCEAVPYGMVNSRSTSGGSAQKA